MARAVGAKSRIVWDEESTYKTDPGTINGRVLPIISAGIKGEQALLRDDTIRGNRNKVAPDLGNLNAVGPIVVNLSETAHAAWLKHLLGAVTTTGAGDPYTHTIKVGDLPVGLVVNKEFTDIGEYHKYNGCRIASADFAVTPEGYIQVTFNAIGAKETRSASAYDATVTEYAHKAFSSFQASLEEGGAAIAIVTGFNFSISNELDEDGYAIGGAGERADLPEGDCVVTGNIEAFFQDDTLLAKARGSTETSLKITLDKQVTPARSVEIFIPELVFGRSGPEISGPKGIKVSLPFEAYYDDSTEASTAQIIVKNGLASI